MSLTITLPEPLTLALQTRAAQEHKSVVDLALKLLADALEADDDFPTLEEIVAQIKSTPPDPTAIHPPQDSLLQLLLTSPTDLSFDLQEWEQEWGRVEAEMKAISQTNAIAEGLD